MNIKYRHSFDVNTEEDFQQIQEELAKEIVLKDKIDIDKIKICAGVDIAYWKKDNEDYGVCSIILIDFDTHEVVEKVMAYGKIDVPYIAGYLAFREMPLIIEAAKKLQIIPDLFMFDGNGYLHSRHMGIATHASLFLQTPTIGVAKSYLKIKNVDFQMPAEEAGAYTDIEIDGELYGRVLRTRNGIKPVFISSGNYITINAVTKICMSLVNKESRIPIPTRLADLETRVLRRELIGTIG